MINWAGVRGIRIMLLVAVAVVIDAAYWAIRVDRIDLMAGLTPAE